MKNIVKHLFLILLSLHLMCSTLYAHDPQVAYTVFKIFGISLLLILLMSLLLSFIILFIIRKINIIYKERKLSVSLFKYTSIFGILLGIIGLLIDYKLASDTEFYNNNFIIFIWLIGVVIGVILGFILEYSKNICK